jgi:D-alanyl-lipoteichoic acid acyltransferase DltB (MBOAT superfamily)
MTFFVFFVVVFGVSWRLRPYRNTWKLFILAASYVFYGWWDWRFCFLLLGSTVANLFFARCIASARDQRIRRRWLVGGLVVNLGVLGFFKYDGFFVDSLITMLRPVGLAPTALLAEIALPVGISFFTFCGISYLVDLERGDVELAAPIDIAVYLSFFPHLVAGPIVRVGELVPQLQLIPNADAVDATRATRLIMRGLFKKMVVANYLAQAITDPVFASPRSFRSWDLLVAAYAFAVQIYSDFSGYTDIAIGCALLLGIRFPENFDRPYTAATLQDFWRRWHMTLSRWLRDYLYIPLGGNRDGTRQMYRNIMLTMVLGGLWHGASWTFVIWGVYHGVGLVVERMAVAHRERPIERRSPRGEVLRDQLGLRTGHGEERHLGPGRPDEVQPVATTQVATAEQPIRERRQNPWLGRIITFNFVTFGWVLFKSSTFTDFWDYIRRLVLAWGTSGQVNWLIVATIIGALAAQYLPRKVGLMLEYRASLLPPVVQGIGFGVFLVAINILGPQGVAPFIYFRF